MRRLIESIEHNYRHISAIAILAALIVDSLTLVRVDLYLTNLLLFIYLAVVGVGIVIINLYEDGRARFISVGVYKWLFIAMQFSLGGLFGRFLIYYSRSGSLYTSWPFLLILAGLLIGNEFANKHYTRLVLQISLFYLALFSYLIFFIPVLLGRMGDFVFIFSGSVSLLIIFGFLWILLRIVPMRISDNSNTLFGIVGAIFILMNLFYFTNIIPPLPLSLREAGVYHSVAKTGNRYLVTGEKGGRLEFLKLYKTVHLLSGYPLYVYSAVFAPTNFDTYIVHNWQYYIKEKDEWESRSKITLPIVGGQDRGYRGYSTKTNLNPGFWRVNIETLRGQVIGRLTFKIEKADQKPILVSDTL